MPSKGFKHPSDFLKGQILAFHKAGINNTEIGRQLGIGEATVRRNLAKYASQGNMVRKVRKPLRKTTAAEDRLIVRAARRNPKSTARQIAIIALGKERASELGNDLIRSRLAERDIVCRVIAEKPQLTPKQIAAHLKFARKYLSWTPEDWSRVLWSDESKFNLFGSDAGPRTCYRMKGERFHREFTRGTVKHGGGSVMVWGCFSSRGLGRLHQIEDIMTGPIYQKILSTVMVPSAYKVFGGADFVFQHDNDPKHTSKFVQNWLSNPTYKLRGKKSIGNFEVLEWPSQSPDLNPIENLWAQLETERFKLVDKPGNKTDLMAILKRAWNKIGRRTLLTLVESMPKRCQDVITAKGWHTKY